MKLYVATIVAGLALAAHGSFGVPPPPPPAVTLAEKAAGRAAEAEAARAARAREAAMPALIRELTAATEEFVRTGAWDKALAVGDNYATGSFPTFVPDAPTALRVFRAVAENAGTAEAADARSRIANVFARDWNRGDSRGAPIPVVFADTVCRAAMMHRVTTGTTDGTGEPVGTAADIGTLLDTVLDTVVEVPTRPVIHADSQNVHDSGVVASVRRRIAALGTRDPKSSMADIRAGLDASNVDADVRARAERVLNQLGVVDHSSFGTSEIDVARGVWDKIQAVPDDEARADAIDMFALQLADAVERGHVVCSTGKISRIVSALDGIDTTGNGRGVDIKPTWAVREELGTLAAKVRDEGGDAAAFRARANEVYVTELGMAEGVVDPMVDMFAAGFD